MMQLLFKFIFLFHILSLTGCQQLSRINSLQDESTLPAEQDKIFRLLRQGKRYDELSNKQSRSVCKRLKKDYQEHSDWQTAWLLVYSLNDKFYCLSPDETLKLLGLINKAQEPEFLLKWLNKNQIQLIQMFNYLKRKSNNRGHLLKEVQEQLKQAQGQLEKLNSNIQELKAIETSINKKSQ